MQAVPGSFRDPAGRVYTWEGRIFRLLSGEGAAYFSAIEGSDFWKRVTRDGTVVRTWHAPGDVLSDRPPEDDFGVERVLEHAAVPFVSYPFEWPFHLLKRAALLHLDLHLLALESDLNIVDGTAYNIQLFGTKPVFIDVLSFRPYRAGDYWFGYQQFCSAFLAPLLLSAYRDVPYNALYRGNLSGIPVPHAATLLPSRAKWNPLVFMHIVAQASLARRMVNKRGRDEKPSVRRPLPKANLIGLLKSLRKGVAGLEPLGIEKTIWSDYEKHNSYDDADTAVKAGFVRRHVSLRKPELLWDIGCNTGFYSETALKAGANYVVGFDFDMGALAKAVARSDSGGLKYLPLYMDLSNPSPGLGWANTERKSLGGRANADMFVALAVIHHLAIAQNVPLREVVEWLVGLAPAGIIEFVPKSDPMVQLLLKDRSDIFPDYTLENFLRHLNGCARVVETCEMASSDRVLIAYERPRA